MWRPTFSFEKYKSREVIKYIFILHITNWYNSNSVCIWIELNCLQISFYDAQSSLDNKTNFPTCRSIANWSGTGEKIILVQRRRHTNTVTQHSHKFIEQNEYCVPMKSFYFLLLFLFFLFYFFHALCSALLAQFLHSMWFFCWWHIIRSLYFDNYLLFTFIIVSFLFSFCFIFIYEVSSIHQRPPYNDL